MNFLYLIVVIPLLTSFLLLLLSHNQSKGWAHLLGVAAPVTSFVLGVIGFFQLQGGSQDAYTQHVFTWIHAGSYTIQYDLLFDPLSAVFVLLISGVGSLILIYSVGYMAHDPRRPRFFAYMNLFVASMLMLVLASDYLGLFLGWEGVGLASYLLIGFWQHKMVAAVAAKKAFVVNRVGDIGMSLAIMLMFATFGSSSFEAVRSGMPDASASTATALGLLLLLGACGKSAQVPLQSWLLDAMEGPTPVSALIHAATMVTAGVYLVVRSNFIYAMSPDARTAVIVVGAVTLLWGAIIGCAKDDIKRALAGSTMSQIGYMMLAAGTGPAGYAFAIFHLLTHGFFKANMFLGAGSVMHGMNDEVDMRKFGALGRAMPITFLTFGCGYLAIIGFPGFAGFFSKDKIIEAALSTNVIAGAAALLGVGITAFYMSRLMIMTFTSQKRWAADAHPHESPPVMTGPLIVLAALSAIGGLLLAGNWIVNWLEPVVGSAEGHEPPIPVWSVTVLGLVMLAVGVAIAYLMYVRQRVPAEAPQRVSPATVAARENLYGDAFNETVLMRPGQYLTRFLVYFDNRGVDGFVNGVAALVSGTSNKVRRWQTGFVRSYAMSMLGGAAVVVIAMLAVRLS